VQFQFFSTDVVGAGCPPTTQLSAEGSACELSPTAQSEFPNRPWQLPPKLQVQIREKKRPPHNASRVHDNR
jgi:hypothetical protein